MNKPVPLLFTIVFLVSIAFAALPTPVGFVNDFAGVLNDTQRTALEASLSALEINTTAEVAVVTVASADDPYGYALQIFDAWKIGKSANDNGLLVLYAKEQNKIQVMTGYGIEGILPDAKIGRLLDDYYVPMRDAGRAAEGIVAVTEQLAGVIYANADEVRAGRASKGPDIFSFMPLIFVIFIFAMPIIARFSGVPKCPVHKVRMKRESSEFINQTFGRTEIVTYVCPVCGRKVKKKRSSGGMFIFAGGHGGGFGGGGFGGGGTGGGGAGR